MSKDIRTSTSTTPRPYNTTHHYGTSQSVSSFQAACLDLQICPSHNIGAPRTSISTIRDYRAQCTKGSRWTGGQAGAFIYRASILQNRRVSNDQSRGARRRHTKTSPTLQRCCRLQDIVGFMQSFKGDSVLIREQCILSSSHAYPRW